MKTNNIQLHQQPFYFNQYSSSQSAQDNSSRSLFKDKSKDVHHPNEAISTKLISNEKDEVDFKKLNGSGNYNTKLLHKPINTNGCQENATELTFFNQSHLEPARESRSDLDDLISKIHTSQSLVKKVKWIHGTSSSIFAFMEKLEQSAIIPTGILRKKYNLSPLSGELGNGTINVLNGSRKSGVNYKFLSGMGTLQKGNIQTAWNYARTFSQFELDKVVAEFRQTITNIEIMMQPETMNSTGNNVYSGRLKKLFLLVLQLKLVVSQAYLKEDYERLNNLLLAIPQLSLNQEHEAKRNITLKYLNRAIREIEQIPDQPNKEFIAMITNSFPILIASQTINGQAFPYGIPGELIVEGSIDFKEHVQIIGAYEKNHEQLRQILSKLQLDHIKIVDIECWY
jgi:hypothetical protein